MNTRVGEQPSGAPYSPLAIQMLLHFYAICTPYRPEPESAWPPAQTKALAHFKAQQLIQPCDYGYSTTEKGDWLARQLTIEFKRLMHGLEMPA